MSSRAPLGRTSALLGVLVALALSAPAARAQYACAEELGDVAGARPYDNPCPREDDLALPMPGELEMLFRRVRVPGGDFWGDPARNVELGDPDARLFEGPRLVSVAGSFRSPDGKSWEIVLGKYEVSVAQYAVIAGEGSLRRGLERLIERASNAEHYARVFDESVSKIEIERILASPVRGLRGGELEAFARRYTDWCYADADCLARLPSFGTMPGFFRLPTEIEWEYAARRRTAIDERASFLPFETAETDRHAFVSNASRVREGPTRIGRLQPTSGGLHDLYGNVAELVDGRFYAELGQGKPGMYVSRGESYAHSSTTEALRPSRRREVQDYRRDDAGTIVPLRSARLGMRLAIGSQTVPNVETLAELESSYAEYRSTTRLTSASGQSTRAGVLGAVDPLDQIDRLVERSSTSATLSPTLATELTRLTEEARVRLQRSSETLAQELTARAAFVAAEAGRTLFRARRARERAAFFENAPGSGARVSVARMRAQAERYTAESAAATTAYVDVVKRLAAYRDFARAAIERARAGTTNPRLLVAIALVRQHTDEALAGRGEPALWREELAEAFADDDLFVDPQSTDGENDR